MYRYVVFDVETPNRYNNRMSAFGISIIEDGSIVDSFFSYVNPETHFDYFNTQLTGIDEETVRTAPTFPELWSTIEPMMNSGILCAHNAVFDLGVLKKCLADYEIEWKTSAIYCCTVQMGRRLLPGISHKLNDMCNYYGIALDHHKADSDSRAAAEILSGVDEFWIGYPIWWYTHPRIIDTVLDGIADRLGNAKVHLFATSGGPDGALWSIPSMVREVTGTCEPSADDT